MPKGSGYNSQGNHYNTPGGTNSSSGSSYHCECSASILEKERELIVRIGSLDNERRSPFLCFI